MVAVLVGALGCQTTEPASFASSRPSARIRLVTGPVGGGSLPLGEEIAEALSEGLQGVTIETIHSAGAVSNVHAIHRGEAEIALTFADVAYLSFSGQLSPDQTALDRVRGIAVLQVAPVALVVRPGLHVNGPADLRGRRIGLGPAGSGTAVTAGLIIRAYGLDAEKIHTESIGFQEGAARLLDGRLDAMFDNAIIPSAALKRAAEGGARFVDIDGPAADRLRREYPFLRATVIAPELYGTLVRTIGVDGLLICRDDLDETLVYALTKQLFASLDTLGRGVLKSMDVKQAPATPVPLHPGAARYYRERELSR